ncbi:NACHT domain [Fusarium albosuccineum]|uniref:NACHT domain n=1 Tax=Fusarium albosuccineum TaxID=1237068 RepID=A0A8H4LD72_9HYPO|nr:NACHT domain [Fusarium albosuccineum]
MASNTYNQVSEVFSKAKVDFLNGVKDPKLRSQLEATTTIDDIWDYTERLQKDQANNKRLRGLKKICPYIERLKEYAGVIEVFVQAKPDVLALIWGPIKLLLQISSNLVVSFDAILDVMKNMGSVLPRFNEFIPLFKNNERMKYVLGLFFQDILDFYLVSLKFFGLTRWKVFFESLWPARRSEIEVITQNIEKHRLLLCNEITLSDILEAHTARQKAFEHYAKTQEFQERQDFHSMETYIRPPSYDQDLDRLHNGRCEGTGTWLLQDPQFTKWAEGDKKSPQVFWLQGIPGAVVDRTKELGHSLFAFLSYRHGLDSTLPIFHSLTFQLASQDRDLRAVLCSTILSSTKDLKRDLKGDSKFALEVFAKLLQAAGPTYVTIDGLDEVNESTQQIFLHQFLSLLEECPEVKLLVSSRRVDRIERILKGTAMALLIDQKNSGCIKTYAARQVKKWLDESTFDNEARCEIRSLLSPLAAKAKGMFLYARIVLESVEMLYDFDSIRDQLNVLPASLDEAYERILEKILKSPMRVQKQSKKILSWIACSPIELTRHEMEQALLVRAGNKTVPRVISTLNTLQLCGPLVKVEDEQLRFVHFTVKELLKFAHFQWAECVRLCARNFRTELPHQLVRLLEQINIDRENLDYNDESSTNLTFWDLKKFKKSPVACGVASRALDFRRLMNSSCDWRLDGEDSYWGSLDPTTISTTVERVYQALENLLCQGAQHIQNCQCSVIQKHHGPRVYVCPFITCRFHRNAFETQTLRDDHVGHHDRPFKCEVQTCEYSTIGFSSRYKCERHRSENHSRSIDYDTSNNVEELQQEDLRVLLLDLVAQDRVDEMARLLPYASKRQGFFPGSVASLLVMNSIASYGSIAMARLVFENWKLVPRRNEFIFQTIIGNNLPVLEWTCSIHELREDSVGQAILTSDSVEAFDIWRNNVLSFGNINLMFSPGIIPRKPNPVMESRLVSFWSEQHTLGNTMQTKVDLLLKHLAQSSCSLILAKGLVACGANVNYRGTNLGSKSVNAQTPLHCAARITTADAAYLAEFLLLSGADPNAQVTFTRGKHKGKTVTPSMELGAKGISKWLYKTWDELVEWAMAKRKEQGK